MIPALRILYLETYSICLVEVIILESELGRVECVFAVVHGKGRNRHPASSDTCTTLHIAQRRGIVVLLQGVVTQPWAIASVQSAL